METSSISNISHIFPRWAGNAPFFSLCSITALNNGEKRPKSRPRELKVVLRSNPHELFLHSELLQRQRNGDGGNTSLTPFNHLLRQAFKRRGQLPSQSPAVTLIHFRTCSCSPPMAIPHVLDVESGGFAGRISPVSEPTRQLWLVLRLRPVTDKLGWKVLLSKIPGEDVEAWLAHTFIAGAPDVRGRTRTG